MARHRNGTPTARLRVKSLKVGFFKARQFEFYSRTERLEIAANKEASTLQCSECGKPALRRFYDPKKGHYGRCKAHIGGAVIPFSYKRIS